MENDRALVAAGVVGAIVAVLCCATPLLAVFSGALGGGARFANAGYLVFPALLIARGVLAFAFTCKRRVQR